MKKAFIILSVVVWLGSLIAMGWEFNRVETKIDNFSKYYNAARQADFDAYLKEIDSIKSSQTDDESVLLKSYVDTQNSIEQLSCKIGQLSPSHQTVYIYTKTKEKEKPVIINKPSKTIIKQETRYKNQWHQAGTIGLN
jgi:hypothetical protein